jgi:hypothetical protein
MVMKMTEIDLVRSPDDMDNETFARHMNKRHHDSLGGLASIRLSMASNGLADSWRAFHRRLHVLRVDLEHEHSEPHDD